MRKQPTNSENQSGSNSTVEWPVAAEVLLIFLLFFLYAGCPPPNVNEAHYLAKAKHYWDPAWCGGDAFLESADAHLVFYWTAGWLTRLMPLAGVAWVGRLTVWLLLALAWQRLAGALVPKWGYALFAAGMVVCLWDRFHMAGEWVVGGFEAKGFAYALLFLALEKLVRGRWAAACWALGAATAFHVLVGGWGMLALLFVMLISPNGQRPQRREMIFGLVGAAVLSLPGLWPALRLTAGTNVEIAQTAAEIYVSRLSHHMEIYKFAPRRIACFVAMLFTWIVLSITLRRGLSDGMRRLQWFVAASLLFALLGAGLDYFSILLPFVMRLLRFYWFRLVDVMVPSGVALLAVSSLAARPKRWAGLDTGWVFAAILIVTAGCSLEHFLRARAQTCPPAFVQGLGGDIAGEEIATVWQDWQDVCSWISRSTPRKACFLTPPTSQTFKWYANRPEVVVWKDIPQDALAIVAWRKRYDDVVGSNIYADDLKPTWDAIRDLADRYGFCYIVVEHGHQINWPLVYRNATFAVYRDPLAANEP